MTRFILCLAFAAQIFAVQSSGTTSVQGIAVIAGSDDPVSGAVVELRSVNDSSAEPLLAATQSSGSFLFRGVPAGRYVVVATRNGYLPAEFGQKNAQGRGVPIVVSTTQPQIDLRITMTPTASVSGRILDRSGQPIAGVPVQLVKPIFQEGRRTMSVMKSMLTNDLGEYRIFWVAPGSYYVNVIPPVDVPPPGGTGIPLIINPYSQPAGRSLWWNAANVTTTPTGNGLPDNEAYLPIFFPGTPDESAATLIDLQAGADVRGIDIRVVPVRAWRIRGVVLNGTTRQPMPGVPLQLISLGPMPRATQANADTMGRFVIPKVPSGPYVLASLVPAAGVGRLLSVEVRDADIEANIELQPFYNLSGRIAASNPTALSIGLRLELGIQNPPQLNTTPAADGSFTLRNVPPGDYRVFLSPILVPQVTSAPTIPVNLQNAYVKSMRLGDTDLLNGRLRLDRPPESPIEIITATDPGNLSGRVLDNRQRPSSGAIVVLMPELERRVQRTDLYKTASTDEAGQFLIEGVPPGDYRLFAWENVGEFAWRDPAFMREVEERGRALRITEGSRQTVELTSIP
jgi:hypothetical protein